MDEQFKSDLFLSVKRNGVARVDDPHADEAEEEFKIAKQKFFHQLDHKGGYQKRECECCGFDSKSFQHIHHKDGDHHNNKTSNFSLRCPLCHYVEHIGYELVANNSVIIMLPEISQEILNNTLIHGFCLNHLLEYNINDDHNDYESLAMMQVQFNALYSAFEQRALKTKQFFGSSDPNFFANRLLEMNDQDYRKRRNSAFKDLRILFKPNIFETEIKFWTNTYFDSNGSIPLKWIQECIKVKDRSV
ncbi:hypothetical protein [Photobacterium leiognathi]|uniref:hypothetical protein n=1 Tax=Photobacterium leiognathi TaxID=553611 RepID=UPI00298183BA|nr:hypothetical protein [Photobacterium leiognathi]